MEDKIVGDLMLPLEEYATVSGAHTLKEALDELGRAQLGLTNDRHHHRAVLVLDESGRVIGKLSHWAILRALEPKYLQAEDLASLAGAGISRELLTNFEDSLSGFWTGLETICAKASRTLAQEAMVQITESIDKDKPLAAAIHQLVLTHVQSMLVTQGGETVGILRLSDVFAEVANRIRDCD